MWGSEPKAQGSSRASAGHLPKGWSKINFGQVEPAWAFILSFGQAFSVFSAGPVLISALFMALISNCLCWVIQE